MAMQSVSLRPGVNVERTLSANEAGVSQAQLIRYKDQMIQTYGGWQAYVPSAIGSTVRALHAWQDAAGDDHLGVGATANLVIITDASNADITPQTATIDSSADFSTTNGSQTVTVSIPDSSGYPSVYSTIFFNTPVSIAGQIISGGYDIVSVLSSISFTISLTEAATATSTTRSLPTFTSTADSATIFVEFPNNGYDQINGLFYPFYAATTITANQIIQGPYQVASVTDSTQFTINSVVQTTASVGPITMNSSLVQSKFYVAIGPAANNVGYGSGAYGSGGYGGVVTGATPVTGTPITATDWTLDNWGQVLLACPEGGPIYTWAPDSALQTAQVISEAPFFNGGIFVSMPQQILVAWRSCQTDPDRMGRWLSQDNLLVVWSDAEDYTNWSVTNETAAGSFRIPTGSLIVGGLQAATQGIIWTDVDAWVMQYIGGDLIFSFNRLGSGCGLIGKHAAGTLGGNVYWCGTSNFFLLGSGGVTPLNCSVWDYIFQNLSATHQSKIVCATNTAFNEVAWFFPSAVSTGENDSYVKYNVLEQEWDYGTLGRTAWVDVSVLGNPIGAATDGTLYQHETGTSLTGVASPSFRTGWWSLSDGNEMMLVDFVIPDFIWGLYSGTQDAQVQVTFYTADYPGATQRAYGPYTVTSATEYINIRARGRLMSMMVQADNQQFFRLGRCRFRYASSGRR